MERDPKLVQKILRLFRPLLKYYYRVEIEGFEKLKQGQFLLVANHNSGAAMEVIILLEAWERYAHNPIPAYGLAHSLGFKFPFIRSLFHKIGALPASPESAQGILKRGNSLAVFPGGNWQAWRPFWQRKICDFGGRKGWAKIAMEENIPTVPIVFMGSHDTNPIFIRSWILSYLLILPKLAGINWFCISLAQLVFSTLAYALLHKHISGLPLAACVYVAFLLSPLVPILPAKIRVKCLDPLLPAKFESVEQLYEKLSSLISAELKNS